MQLNRMAFKTHWRQRYAERLTIGQSLSSQCPAINHAVHAAPNKCPRTTRATYHGHCCWPAGCRPDVMSPRRAVALGRRQMAPPSHSLANGKNYLLTDVIRPASAWQFVASSLYTCIVDTSHLPCMVCAPVDSLRHISPLQRYGTRRRVTSVSSLDWDLSYL